jgi:hypothetical protein
LSGANTAIANERSSGRRINGSVGISCVGGHRRKATLNVSDDWAGKNRLACSGIEPTTLRVANKVSSRIKINGFVGIVWVRKHGEISIAARGSDNYAGEYGLTSRGIAPLGLRRL